MSLKPKINSNIDSDIDTSIESSAATTVNKSINTHIESKIINMSEYADIIPVVNSYTSEIITDDITMYNNFVADDIYASKAWVLSQNYVTKDEISFDIPDNLIELINNKADKNHNHNNIYYSKTILDSRFNNINVALENKADINHNHDDIYCTNEEHSADINQINTSLQSLNNKLDTKTTGLQTYINNNFATIASVPTKTSDLVNDSNLINSTELNNAINSITTLIPNTATVENQLTDKNFVNSSIATATAEFRGTVENIEDLNNVIANINDYAFYKHTDANGNTVFDRYKFNDKWDYEYTLNNSSFTAEQWATINSGLTENSIPTKTSELTNDSDYTTSKDIQIAINNIPHAGFEDILAGAIGRTKVEWNDLNAGEYGSNSTYNGATLPPIMLESTTAFWNSGSGKPLDISFHFTKKEKITSLQVKCPPYGNSSSTMTVYYAQKGDTELTLYKEIATISIVDRKSYDFNEEGIYADYWVVRFTAPGWIDLRLCKPGGLFTPGLYSEVFHEQLMDKLDGYQPVGNYALKSEIPTVNNASLVIQQNGVDIATFTANSATDTTVDISIPSNYVDLSSDQTIAGKKVFSTKPVYEEHVVVGHNLPDEYQEVEYIQSGGTQYIDTGINPKIKPRLVVNMMLLNSADQDYWGNKAIDGSSYFANFAGGILMYYRYGRTSSINTGVSAPFNEFHEWDVSDAIYLDKVKLHTTPNVYTYNANQSNIYLFRSARSYGNFRASYFILYDGDEKVREYYPCYRKSDNAVGLFDKVSNTFFPNLGSGVFIKGNDVISGETVVERELISNDDITAYLKNIANYDVNKIQVLKNVNGIFKWIDE